jgi:Domain of unknown function (DUF1905)
MTRKRESSDLGDVELRFHGEVFHWRGPSPYHFVRVPDDGAGLIHALAPMVTYGWGVILAEGRIGATEFTTALFPKDGGYLVPIKDAVRRAEDLAIGDDVEVLLVIRT